jgi:TolA-binding protein
MKKNLFAPALLSLLIISCAGAAKPQEDETPAASPRPVESAAAENEEAGLGDGTAGLAGEGQGREGEAGLPEAGAALPPPEEAAAIEELAEPEIDLAEADLAEAPPEETMVFADLSEPEAPDFPPAAESAAVEEPSPPLDTPPEPPIAESVPEDTESAPSVTELAPVLPPSPAPAAPVSPPPPPSPPPARQASPPPPAEPPYPRPPAFLGPAEEEQPPAIVREPPPVPAAPQPEPPAEIIPLPQPRSEEIVFSRTVRATVGQLVEIPFRGSGWVYLGELGSRRGIVYDSRRLDPEGQSFVFRTEAAGTYALKFYRQDFIRDFILNDHVQVIVEAPEAAGAGWFNPPLDRGRVIAEPRWPNSLEEAERARQGPTETASASPQSARPSGEVASAAENAAGAAGAEGGALPAAENAAGAPAAESRAETVAGIPAAPENAAGQAAAADAPPERPAAEVPPAEASPAAGSALPELPANSPPEIFLQKAKEEFDAGRVDSAISLLDQFRGRYPSGSDEAYWLYGQFYEANTPSRDILSALSNYRRLVREYPQSSRYNDARRRIAYLERYYINIQ